MKKALKIIGIILVVLIILVFLAPILFKGPIERSIKKSINNNVNATVSWEKLDLSLYKSFPDALVTLRNLSVVNKEPFAGDTLASGEEIRLSMDIPQLFKSGDEPLSINELILNRAFINVKVDSLGNANYDIAKESTSTAQDTTSSDGGLSLDVQHYEINDSRINYLDEASKTYLRLSEFNHKGTGDFSASTTTLETTSTGLISFEMDSVNYLKNHKLKLDADFELDLENQKYTFLENEAYINQLPLTFNGFVKINENNNEIDLTFKTPSSDFKNFLAVIPETYAKNLDGVDTTGDFMLNGIIKGVIDETHIPTLDISVKSDNASFKFAELPKRVENIHIDALLKNETGIVADTYLNLDKLNFKIDQDVFSATGNFKNLTENMLVNLAVNGTLNLGHLEQAYPLDLDMDLNGILKANFTTNFDMNSIEKERYQNVKSNGKASITNFKYVSPEIPNDVNIAKASLNFNSTKVNLEEMQITSGQTDANVSGSLENLMGYMFSDQDLKGRFNVQSNTFSLNDFMIASAEAKPGTGQKTRTTPASKEEAIKIPSFLDARLDFTANKVLYDNLTLNNAKGTLIIKDETARLENITSNIFGGNIAINGNVSTKNATPTFDMKLGLNSIDIVQSFNGMEIIQNLAPIAKALQGNLNTTLNLKGNLTKDLTPIMASLAGDAFAQILDAKVDSEKMPLLSRLDGSLDFINLDNLNLKDLQTNLTFSDGNINLKPFDFDVKGIKVTAGGSHSFENVMNYHLDLNIPAKYLGSEVGGQLAKLSATEIESMNVNLPIGLSGSFDNPNININTKQAVQELTQRIIEVQKDKAIESTKDKIKDFIDKNTNPEGNTNTTPQDSTGATPNTTKEKDREDKIKEAAGNVLKDLFGKGKNKDKN
ncbi:AsmA-like C-terminal region-containing protein [Mesonia ostreae]|uniref:AsmA-like C-terminal region-containing protein n=1 Tax=Mesonia ostreae TaxID=861110 RepID=A0ABU2KG55_9FLAO|nr:AsmA-like C-terminal region-containing protein [Mesonia ostreae]MDT0293685.1 AsmA-like C-terminal region-containing protein [Mesonia ostreae]